DYPKRRPKVYEKPLVVGSIEELQFLPRSSFGSWTDTLWEEPRPEGQHQNAKEFPELRPLIRWCIDAISGHDKSDRLKVLKCSRVKELPGMMIEGTRRWLHRAEGAYHWMHRDVRNSLYT